jgi:FkbM family methyltransferase
MIQDTPSVQSFLQKANDLRCRALHHRAGRVLRGKLRNWCSKGMLLADDPRVLVAWRRGWDAEHYVRLQRWKDSGFEPRIVYDIGAHTGVWSAMCQSVFPHARFYLFEPQRACHEQAQARQPSGASWQILPVALGDEDATRSLFVTQNLTASSLFRPVESSPASSDATSLIGQEEVQVVTLDEIVQIDNLPLPDLIKIDVQGYEARVLAGGKRTFAQAQRLIVESALQPIYEAQALLPEVLSGLSNQGFTLDDMSEAYRKWPGPIVHLDLWLKRGVAKLEAGP